MHKSRQLEDRHRYRYFSLFLLMFEGKYQICFRSKILYVRKIFALHKGIKITQMLHRRAQPEKLKSQ